MVIEVVVPKILPAFEGNTDHEYEIELTLPEVV